MPRTPTAGSDRSRQPVQLAERTPASRPSSVTMTSGASCTWSQPSPQAPCRRRPCTRAAPTCSSRSPAWRDRRVRSPTGDVTTDRADQQVPALAPRARPARARRGRRRRTAGCRRCRSGWSPRSCGGCGHRRGLRSATYVASRPRAAYTMSAKSRSASTTSGSPRSSPSSHSPATDCLRGLVGDVGVGVAVSPSGAAGGREGGDPHPTSNPHITPTVASRHRLTWRRRAGPRLCCRMTRIPCGQGVLRPEGCRWSVLGLFVCPARTPSRSTGSSVGWTSSRRSVRSSGLPLRGRSSCSGSRE